LLTHTYTFMFVWNSNAYALERDKYILNCTIVRSGSERIILSWQKHSVPRSRGTWGKMG